MPFEWLILAAFIAVGFYPVFTRSRRFPRVPLAIAFGGITLVIVAACHWGRQMQQKIKAHENTTRLIPRAGRSGGYVASDKCQACHPNEYASWHRTFHRTMTQRATPETVRGDFNDVKLALNGETFYLRRQGDEFWAEMDDPDWKRDSNQVQRVLQSGGSTPRVQKRIAMMTGSHHMQAYWISGRSGNEQAAFPFTYLFEDQRWAPRADVFLRDPKIPQALQVWNLNCINCHSTAGQPRQDPHSRIIDSHVGELGIACESCHGPAERHVAANRSPARRYELHRLSKTKADPTIVNPARQAPKRSSQVCGQCHGVNWIPDREDWRQNGFRYRPGDDLQEKNPVVQPTKLETQPWFHGPLQRNPALFDGQFWPDGIIRVSGREYNGLVESPCYQRGELSCLSCHSMHKSDPNDQLAERMETNHACVQCHKSHGETLEAHTHHAPNSTGSLCYNCHMPHTTYGLLKAIRSHTIDSPSVQSSLETGRPNACNLCHLDKTLGWTAGHLSQWHGAPKPDLNSDEQTIAAALLWLLKGDAGQRALVAWSMGWEPAKQASGEKWLPPFLIEGLKDPYAAVRYIAERSLKRLPGFRDVVFDFVGSPDERTRAAEHALQAWNETRSKTLDRAGAEVLMPDDGKLARATIDRLLRERNHRSIELQE